MRDPMRREIYNTLCSDKLSEAGDTITIMVDANKIPHNRDQKEVSTEGVTPSDIDEASYARSTHLEDNLFRKSELVHYTNLRNDSIVSKHR